LGAPGTDYLKAVERSRAGQAVGQLRYAVCTECDFLRVLARDARDESLPEACPKCGSDVVLVHDEPRFAPAYVGRVSRALHNTEPLPRSKR
jgi:hypothetical protein